MRQTHGKLPAELVKTLGSIFHQLPIPRPLPKENVSEVFDAAFEDAPCVVKRNILPTLGSNYILSKEDNDEFQEYIETYPFLLLLLKEAHDKIGEYFPESSLTITFYTYLDNNRKMALNINTSLEVKEATEIEKRFDYEWWLRKLPEAQGKLLIIVNYID